MKCKVCGTESGKYPLCRVCNTKKEKGEIIKCEKCGNWHYTNAPCPVLAPTTDNDKYLYDKFLTHFLNKNNLLNEKEDYNTIILNNEDDGTHFTIQYEESIFDIIETQAKERVRYIRYKDAPITYQQSIFKYYNLLDSVRSLYFFDLSDEEYLPDRLIDNILTGEVPENASIIDEMIIKHFNNEYESIYNINIDRLNWYRVGYTIHDFRKIPILLYLLRYNIHKFLSM